MRFHRFRLLASLLFSACLVPLLVHADSNADRLEENRKLLEKAKEDPQHFARLQQDLAAFRALPPEKQEKLRALDRELHEEKPGMRARLTKVMERYSDWYERLPEAEKQSIESAATRKESLQRIRELKVEQWQKKLPKNKRDQIKKAPERDRADLIQRLWLEDAEERADWALVSRFGELARSPLLAPTGPEMLTGDARRFIDDSLRPLLNKDDERRLKEAEGKWPRYPRTLLELVDANPLSVLGPIGPTRLKDLPATVQEIVQKEKLGKKYRERLREAEGKWPEFGLTLREISKGPLQRQVHPLLARCMPDQPGEFPVSVQHFIDRRLLPALDEDEKARLNAARGNWPAYPRLIVDLAQKHNLPIPSEATLPGKPEIWDRYRSRSVIAPDQGPGRRSDPFVLLP